MSSPKYVIGIDLGTTHSVVSYASLGEEQNPELKMFDIMQIIAPNEMKSLPLLPSFTLIVSPHDVSSAGIQMPWHHDGEVEYIIGEYARKRGAELPYRLISSAKSWLCHTGIDRSQPLLPWGSPQEVKKVSPIEATSLIIRHIINAWNYKMAQSDEDNRMEEQDIYITVPASFDAVARELTVEAAKSAGLKSFTLLEEPQAAFYGWLYYNEKTWRDLVKVGDIILICDIGGGTTDFSLIEVAEEEGALLLKRIAVGDHILLGGDNMDLTLAYLLRGKIKAKLDEWQFRMLWYQSRIAKEKLLERDGTSSEPVVILGRGTSLIGGAIKTELTEVEVGQVLLEGFFPHCSIDERPRKQTKVGMREMGLPYEDDPAITRHMASFVSRQLKEAARFPSAILFNGGVMKARGFRRRVIDVVQSWNDKKHVRELTSPDLDLSVARGAAYYGFVRRGKGIRIRAGVSRTYYLGIESAMPTVPGIPTPIKALCIVPFGTEEGTSTELKEKEFGLVVGEPAIFKLMASTIRKEDEVGAIVEDWEGEIQPVATMETTLIPESGEKASSAVVPVWIQSNITEIGTLELHCVDALNTSRKWKLSFNLKERENLET